MNIIGFQKLTLVDYPGKVAAILFTGGCNFRCPYCHNGELVLYPEDFPPYPDEDIFSYLDKRKGILDGVVVSGGEPTLQADLAPYLERIKERGLLVKLDTNGTRPGVIRKLVEGKLVDYIAMDVKNSLSGYARTIGLKSFDTSGIEESISYLKEGHVEYEFRTTVTRELHHEENIRDLALLLKGCRAYYLQNYVSNENTISKNNSPLSLDELKNYIEILRLSIENVSIRNS